MNLSFCLVASYAKEKEALEDSFCKQLTKAKEENASELISMQRIIKQCQEDIQLKQSSHDAVVGFLKAEVGRFERENQELNEQLALQKSEILGYRQKLAASQSLMIAEIARATENSVEEKERVSDAIMSLLSRQAFVFL